MSLSILLRLCWTLYSSEVARHSSRIMLDQWSCPAASDSIFMEGVPYNLPKSNVLHFSYMSPVHFSFYSKHFSETLSDACGGKCSVQFRQEHHSFLLTGCSKDSSTSSSPTPFHSASTSQCCYIYYWAEFKICLCYIKTSCKNESIIIIE